MRNFNRAALRWTQPEFQPIFDEASAKIKDSLEMHWDNASVELAIKDFKNLSDMFETLLLHSPSYLLREIAEGCSFLKDLNSLQKDGQEIDQSLYEKMEQYIIQGILQFPSLIEYLSTGRKDLPSLVLPLINQMRLLRSVPVLSQSQMFAPDTFIDTGFIGQEEVSSQAILQSLVSEVHHQFQSSLISWIRKPQSQEPLYVLSSSSMRLARLARHPSLKKLFWVGAVMFEAIANDGFVASRDCNVFLAKMDLLAPWVGENIISPDQKQDVEKTLQHLLYYVTFEGLSNPGLESVVDLFALEALYHTQDDLDAARSIMSGKGSDTLSVVAKNLKEDIHRVRDHLDLYVRMPQQDTSFVDNVIQSLENAQLTLQVLSMNDAAMLALAQKEHMIKIAPQLKQNPIASPSLIKEIEEIASDLLIVEEELSSLHSHNDDNSSSSLNIRHSVITQLLVNLARARHLVVTYATNKQASDVEGLPLLLQEVSSALMLINEIPASNSFRKLQELAKDMASSGSQVKNQQDIENFAHALACLEYYIEAIRDDQPDPSRMISAARDYLLEFGPHMDPEISPPLPEPTPSHIDDLSVKVELDHMGGTAPAPSDIGLKSSLEISSMSEPEDTVSVKETEEDSISPVFYGTVLFYETEDNLIDQDIRDIFIEELSDEIENIQSFIDSGASPSLDEIKNVRKSFHTIKGSGRMTNALALGEVAYAGELLFTKILEGHRPYSDVIKKFAQKANMMFAQFYLSATTGKPLVWEQDEIISWAQKLAHGQNISWESHVEMFEEDRKNFVQPDFSPKSEEHIAFVAFSPSIDHDEKEEQDLQEPNFHEESVLADNPPIYQSSLNMGDDNSFEERSEKSSFEMDIDLIAQDMLFHEVEQKSQQSEQMPSDMSHEMIFDLGDLSTSDEICYEALEDHVPEFHLEDFTSPDLTTAQDLDIFSKSSVSLEATSEEIKTDHSVKENVIDLPHKDTEEGKISFDGLSLLSMDDDASEQNETPIAPSEVSVTSASSWDLSSLSLEPLDGEDVPQDQNAWRFDPTKSVLAESNNENDEEAVQNTSAIHSLQSEHNQIGHVPNTTVPLAEKEKDEAPSLSSIDDLNAWTEQVDTGDDEVLGFEPIVIVTTSGKKQEVLEGASSISETLEDVVRQDPQANLSSTLLVQEPLHLEMLPSTKTKQEDWKEYISLMIDYNKSLLEWLDECQKYENLSPANQKVLINNLMGYQKRESFLLSKALEKMTEVEGLAIKNEIKKILFPAQFEEKGSTHHQEQPQNTNIKPREKLIVNQSSASPHPPEVPTRVKQAPVAPPHQGSAHQENSGSAPKPQHHPQRPVSDQSTNFKVVQPVKEKKTSWWRKIFKRK